MVEYKPCPFCGESENLVFGQYNGTMRGYFYVECEDCGVELRVRGDLRTAIEAWNKRADDKEKEA